MTRPLTFALAGALLLGPAAPVAAHSLLLESTPAAGAVVVRAPSRVTLRFNNRIEARLSRLRLIDAQGEARGLLALGDGPPQQLQAALPPLAPGVYRLQWRVFSTDGHRVSGSFSFRVAP